MKLRFYFYQQQFFRFCPRERERDRSGKGYVIYKKISKNYKCENRPYDKLRTVGAPNLSADRVRIKNLILMVFIRRARTVPRWVFI